MTTNDELQRAPKPVGAGGGGAYQPAVIHQPAFGPPPPRPQPGPLPPPPTTPTTSPFVGPPAGSDRSTAHAQPRQARPAKPSRPLPPWRRPVGLAVAAAAVAADVAIRVPLTSVAAALAIAASVAVLATAGRLDRRLHWAGAGGCLVGAALLAVRASPWVGSIVGTAVIALLLLIAADGLTTSERSPWLRSIVDGFVALADSIGWLRVGMTGFASSSRAGAAVIVRAALVAVTASVTIGALLASGDAAFGGVIALLDLPSVIGHLLMVTTWAVPAAGLALLSTRATPDRHPSPAGGGAPRFRTEALAGLWAVALTLLVWCGVQVTLVMGGARSVLADQGITPAEYARQGFFQLVAVAAITLTVVNGAHRLGRSDRGPDRTQRVPAGLIGVALVGLIVVSYSRLAFYMGVFGLTMLRVAVATFLGWLAVMTAMSVARSFGSGQQSNWLPAAAVTSAAVFALVFGAVNPERWVALSNLERADSADEVDVHYLTTRLSPDAKAAVADYGWARLGGMPPSVVAWLCERPADAGYGPLGWNLARASQPDVTCPAVGAQADQLSVDG